MDFQEMKVAIQLIESAYNREERNTPEKMIAIIKKEFPNHTPPTKDDILHFYGIPYEDEERIQRNIEYENRFGRDF